MSKVQEEIIHKLIAGKSPQQQQEIRDELNPVVDENGVGGCTYIDLAHFKHDENTDHLISELILSFRDRKDITILELTEHPNIFATVQELLRTSTCLETILIHDHRLSDAQIADLINALASNENNTLKTLPIIGNRYSQTDKAFSSLEAFLKSSSSIKKIKHEKTWLKNLQLANFLGAIANNPKSAVEELHVSMYSQLICYNEEYSHRMYQDIGPQELEAAFAALKKLLATSQTLTQVHLDIAEDDPRFIGLLNAASTNRHCSIEFVVRAWATDGETFCDAVFSNSNQLALEKYNSRIMDWQKEIFLVLKRHYEANMNSEIISSVAPLMPALVSMLRNHRVDPEQVQAIANTFITGLQDKTRLHSKLITAILSTLQKQPPQFSPVSRYSSKIRFQLMNAAGERHKRYPLVMVLFMPGRTISSLNDDELKRLLQVYDLLKFYLVLADKLETRALPPSGKKFITPLHTLKKQSSTSGDPSQSFPIHPSSVHKNKPKS